MTLDIKITLCDINLQPVISSLHFLYLMGEENFTAVKSIYSIRLNGWINEYTNSDPK